MPAGYRIATLCFGSLSYSDNGAAYTNGEVVGVAGERWVRLCTETGANWTNTSSDNTSVEGSILCIVAKD